MSTEKKQVTVSQLLADVNAGLTRSEIKAKYELSGKDMATAFSHPKLKGVKAKAKSDFELVDDTDEASQDEVAGPVEDTTQQDEVEDNTPIQGASVWDENN